MSPKDQKQGQAQSSSFDTAGPARRPTGQVPIAGGKTPTGQIPATGKTPTGQIPIARTTSTGVGLPAEAAAATKPAAAAATQAPTVATALNAFQKGQMGSAFASGGTETKRVTVLGTGARPTVETEEAPAQAWHFDGVTAAEEVTGRDVWKAVKAPVSSREGKRSPALTEQVLAQFAVGTNPRYQDDAPGKPRGHIFVWDVSRAMGCEIPHFAGARELTLPQTVDWLRHEGPMRGWLKTSDFDVFEHAAQGQLVVAIPKEVRVKGIALVAPQEAQQKPLLTGAGLVRGHLVHPRELFGVMLLEYYFHA